MAQGATGGGGGSASAGGGGAAGPTSSIAVTLPGGGLEEAISGRTYRLGPGDSLTVNIWGAQPISFGLLVTLEGNVILPEIGLLKVDGLTLDDARAQITQAVLRGFHNVTVTVSLIHLRRFQVHVLGQVYRPGTYVATAVDRVSSAVGWAGGFTPNASQRRIAVSMGDSVRAWADLFAFLARGVSLFNPLLHDGDIIYVPFVKDRFSVQGAVNQPGDFEYLPKDRFGDALLYSGGLTTEALRDTIEVVRYVSQEKDERRPMRFFALLGGDLVPARPEDASLMPPTTGRCSPLAAMLASEDKGQYPDFELHADDMVFVRAIPESRVRRLVEVQGEVAHPGQFAITEGETRLADVLRWAGGVTSDAFLKEAQLIRRESIRLEDKEYERLSKVPPSEMTKDEYEYYKLRSREERGLMVVDFEKVVLQGDARQDILLKRGDLIKIPTLRDFVSVLGMVVSPGNIPYEPGLKPDDYIRKVGGYAERAERSKGRVIRAASGEWVRLKDADHVEPGDAIWVPERASHDYWVLLKDVIGVTTQILTIYLVVDRAIKP